MNREPSHAEMAERDREHARDCRKHGISARMQAKLFEMTHGNGCAESKTWKVIASGWFTQARLLEASAAAQDRHAQGKPLVGSKPNRTRGGKSTPPRPF